MRQQVAAGSQRAHHAHQLLTKVTDFSDRSSLTRMEMSFVTGSYFSGAQKTGIQGLLTCLKRGCRILWEERSGRMVPDLRQ